LFLCKHLSKDELEFLKEKKIYYQLPIHHWSSYFRNC